MGWVPFNPTARKMRCPIVFEILLPPALYFPIKMSQLFCGQQSRRAPKQVSRCQGFVSEACILWQPRLNDCMIQFQNSFAHSSIFAQ